MKVLEAVIKNRLEPANTKAARINQAGFKKGVGCRDQALRCAKYWNNDVSSVDGPSLSLSISRRRSTALTEKLSGSYCRNWRGLVKADLSSILKPVKMNGTRNGSRSPATRQETGARGTQSFVTCKRRAMDNDCLIRPNWKLVYFDIARSKNVLDRTLFSFP